MVDLVPVDHDPWADPSGSQVAPSIAAATGAADVAPGILSGARAFASGGLQGLANQQGVATPEWSQAAGKFLTSEPVNTAIGMALPLKGAGAALSPLKVMDEGSRLRIEPEAMQVPSYGKGLSWGLTAHRIERGGEKAMRVSDMRLPEEMQNQGYGTAMYKHAIDLAHGEGIPFTSDSTVTEAAANTWMRLHREGYPVQMAPNKIYRAGPPEAPELGRFETPDGSPVFRVEPPKPQGITAYHGSPHDFEKFDLSRIGTGEGAQIFARGVVRPSRRRHPRH